MHTQHATADSAQDVVAEVMGEPITAAQLARHEKEQNYLAGRDKAGDLQRISMLMDMVRASTLRTRTRYNDKNLPDCRKQAEEEIARLATRARNPEQFESWVKSQGYRDSAELTDKLEVRLRSLCLLERAIAPHCQVSDADVARHYELIKDQLFLPAHRTAKHIFLETAGKDEALVQQQAQAIMQRLLAGEDFASLARECSQDTHTAPQGGKLGILWDDARRPLPELPLFGPQAVDAEQPTIAKSRWGWHIIVAGEITPARHQTLAEAHDSIRSALISAQREIAIDTYFTTGVREAIRRQSIKIHAK